ncbi:hypothetical protein PTI98_011449 [Pleurotus ostreatus]|uniref:Uncharacterized protein n=1 Tax=Pleurotus cornucopiae TaxID=5321 RepID=A0ACB7JCS9_PLECO|nr:hypothetical protein CCMSSC00406_0008658 [Pleurotus cornucopiae]KAJ8691930.1 hypothetical protein PTI98_011449 [Pleurotus ostreatus]
MAKYFKATTTCRPDSLQKSSAPQTFDVGAAQQCCNALEAILTSSAVLYPCSLEYDAQLSTYYTLEQAAQRPACRIAPTTTKDVALIMGFATTSGCEFAVRSGGNMSWEGSSNIGAHGFTIDLQGLKGIEFDDDAKTVSVAPRLTWGEIYAFPKPHGLHTMGARASSVGIGGFLLGGKSIPRALLTSSSTTRSHFLMDPSFMLTQSNAPIFSGH